MNGVPPLDPSGLAGSARYLPARRKSRRGVSGEDEETSQLGSQVASKAKVAVSQDKTVLKPAVESSDVRESQDVYERDSVLDVDVEDARAGRALISRSKVEKSLNATMFAHIFGDTLIGGSELEGYFIEHTAAYLAAALRRLSASAMSGASKKLDLAAGGLEKLQARAADIENVPRGTDAQRRTAIEAHVKRYLAELESEGAILIPGGWDKHAMVYKLEKTERTFKFSVFQSGDGISHHDQIVVGSKVRYSPEFVIADIDPENASTDFLVALFEAQVFSRDLNGDDLYSFLASSLGGTIEHPVDSLGESEILDSFVTSQRSGTCSFRCLLSFLRKELGDKSLYKQVMTELKVDALMSFFKCAQENSAGFVGPPSLTHDTTRVLLSEALFKMSKNLSRPRLSGIDPARKDLLLEAVEYMLTVLRESAPLTPLGTFIPVPQPALFDVGTQSSLDQLVEIDAETATSSASLSLIGEMPFRFSPVDDSPALFTFIESGHAYVESLISAGKDEQAFQFIGSLFEALPVPSPPNSLGGEDFWDQMGSEAGIETMTMMTSLIQHYFRRGFKGRFDRQTAAVHMLNACAVMDKLAVSIDSRLSKIDTTPGPFGFSTPFQTLTRFFHIEGREKAMLQDLQTYYEGRAGKALYHLVETKPLGNRNGILEPQEIREVTGYEDIVKALKFITPNSREAQRDISAFVQDDRGLLSEEAGRLRETVLIAGFFLGGDFTVRPPVGEPLGLAVKMDNVGRNICDYSVVFKGTQSRAYRTDTDMSYVSASFDDIDPGIQQIMTFLTDRRSPKMFRGEKLTLPTSAENQWLCVKRDPRSELTPAQFRDLGVMCAHTVDQIPMVLDYFSQRLELLEQPAFMMVFEAIVLDDNYLDQYLKEQMSFSGPGFQKVDDFFTRCQNLFPADKSTFLRVAEIVRKVNATVVQSCGKPLSCKSAIQDQIIEWIDSGQLTPEDASNAHALLLLSIADKESLESADCRRIVQALGYMSHQTSISKHIDPKLFSTVKRHVLCRAKDILGAMGPAAGFQDVANALVRDVQGMPFNSTQWQVDGNGMLTADVFGIDMMTGTLFKSGRPYSGLPEEIRDHSSYRSVFGLRSVPVVQEKGYYQMVDKPVRFLRSAKEVVIQQQCPGLQRGAPQAWHAFVDASEPSLAFLPKQLRDDHTHWIHPSRESAWILDRDGRQAWSVDLIAGEIFDAAGNHLENIYGNDDPFFNRVGHFEDLDYMTQTVASEGVEEGPVGLLQFHRYGLSFMINESSSGRRYMLNDSALGALFISEHQMLLDFNETQSYLILENNQGNRFAIFPNDEIVFEKTDKLDALRTAFDISQIGPRNHVPKFFACPINSRSMTLKRSTGGSVEKKLFMAELFFAKHDYDSAMFYLDQCWRDTPFTKSELSMIDRMGKLMQATPSGKSTDAVAFYMQILKLISDSVSGLPGDAFLTTFRDHKLVQALAKLLPGYLDRLNGVS
ncbi:MAG: hypothetical protein ACI9BD_000985, partial [Candidatus Marinamargulisbacteria bacterium]